MIHSLKRHRVPRSLQFGGVAAALAMGAALMPGSALAGPIALVLDKSENIDVSAFAELMPGDVVDLGSSGHIDLLDYAACQEVRVKSGVLSVSSSGF
ncbi:hypothetical protein QW131_07595 [Roseibium salinum]|nr:hypothetical protein [Roseibium salinum]